METSMQYRARVLEAYEDEVAGAAYFDGLALRFPQQSGFFQQCAALERATALQLTELLHRYQLTPATAAALAERGTLQARTETASDWRQLMRRSVVDYARYVADFRALEAQGPPEDQAVLVALTAHEVLLIEWLRLQSGS